MGYFVESLAKVKEDEVGLFFSLHIFGEFIDQHYQLSLAGPPIESRRTSLLQMSVGSPRQHM